MKEFEEYRKWKYIPFTLMQITNIVKISILPK
jgi:hypothetical protein